MRCRRRCNEGRSAASRQFCVSPCQQAIAAASRACVTRRASHRLARLPRQVAPPLAGGAKLGGAATIRHRPCTNAAVNAVRVDGKIGFTAGTRRLDGAPPPRPREHAHSADNAWGATHPAGTRDGQTKHAFSHRDFRSDCRASGHDARQIIAWHNAMSHGHFNRDVDWLMTGADTVVKNGSAPPEAFRDDVVPSAPIKPSGSPPAVACVGRCAGTVRERQASVADLAQKANSIRATSCAGRPRLLMHRILPECRMAVKPFF